MSHSSTQISTSTIKLCEVHFNSPCDLLYFNPASNDPLICSECSKIQNIPSDQLYKVAEIMKLKPKDILPGFTSLLLFDPSASERITKNQKALQEIIQDYTNFYKEITLFFKETLRKLMEESNCKLDILRNAEKDIISSYRKAFPIENLQEILAQNNSDQMRNLREFIREISQNGLVYKSEIQAKCQKFEEYQMNMEVTNLAGIFCAIDKLFQQTELFKKHSKTIQSQSNEKEAFQPQSPPALSLVSPKVPSRGSLLPSLPSLPSFSISSISLSPSMNYRNSDKNTVIFNEKNSNSILIKNIGTEAENEIAQCYITNPLNKYQKYIIRIQICHNSLDPIPGYAFGLSPEKFKDKQFLCNEGISYSEPKGRDISKIVKGKQLHAGMTTNISEFNNKIIEFRIDLGRKFLRAADFPEFKNISELENPNSIKDNIIYYFTIFIEKSPNSVRITDAFTVDSFTEII